jgi:hypothetical protein
VFKKGDRIFGPLYFESAFFTMNATCGNHQGPSPLRAFRRQMDRGLRYRKRPRDFLKYRQEPGVIAVSK